MLIYTSQIGWIYRFHCHFCEKLISSAFSSLPISPGSSFSTFSLSVSSLLLFRSVASSLPAGGLTHRGGGHKTSQAEPTEREMEGKRERERAGASDFVTASKGKVFPRERENEGDGKRGREREMEIKGKLH